MYRREAVYTSGSMTAAVYKKKWRMWSLLDGARDFLMFTVSGNL